MSWLAELLAVIAPPGCPACRRALVRADERLCPPCTRALPWLLPGCPRCGLPRHRGTSCPAERLAFPRAWAPLAYQGVARRLVAALKFDAVLPVADLMAAHMAATLPAALRDLARGDDAVAPPGGTTALGRVSSPSSSSPSPTVCDADVALVPVPPQRARRRARGYDPAGALTAALARRLSLPVAACLVREDRAGRQVGAGLRARRTEGRIVVRVRGSPPPRVLLVDDVHTTGATLDACARALVGARVEVVAALSYARTL
jgi:predicted amidophosphoribosyltransferase